MVAGAFVACEALSIFFVCSVVVDGLLCCETLSILVLTLDGSDSRLTASRYAWGFEVCAMEQESLLGLCTCGAPTPE